MNVSFFLLLIVLFGLAFLTQWNIHVIMMLVCSACLWAAMIWSVIGSLTDLSLADLVGSLSRCKRSRIDPTTCHLISLMGRLRVEAFMTSHQQYQKPGRTNNGIPKCYGRCNEIDDQNLPRLSWSYRNDLVPGTPRCALISCFT